MPIYELIRKELIDDIVKASSAIAIIDELKETKQPTSKEQFSFLKRLKLRHSPEVIALMLESKAQKRNEKLATTSNLREYNPILLCNEEDVSNFTKYLAGLPDGMPYHYDIIFRPGDNHSGAIQIHSDGSSIHMFFIENATDQNETDRNKLIDALGRSKLVIHNYVDGSLLEENYGCSIFAIQHLNSMNRLFNEIDHNLYLTQGYNTIERLDPVFIKHIQPTDSANSYALAHPEDPRLYIDKKRTKALRDHVDNNTITASTLSGKVIRRNYSILYKTKKYLEEALKTLEAIHAQPDGDRLLNEVISKRTGHDILNNVYTQMHLTHEEIERVNGLYNQEQIKLALLYNIPKEELQSAKCFSTKDTSRATYDVIFNKSDGNMSFAMRIFDELKSLSTMNQFQAVVNYGIDPHEASTSLYLDKKLPIFSPMEYLQGWYEKAGTNGAKAAFKIMKLFELGTFRETTGLDNLTDLYHKNADDFLKIAIKAENTELIDLWLNAGANINYIGDSKLSPLDLAIKTNNPEIVQKIIMNGAKLHRTAESQASNYFSTKSLSEYLKSAIDQDNIKVIENLLTFSPKLINFSIDGVTPIAYAMHCKKAKAAKYLLTHKENISRDRNFSSVSEFTNIIPFRKKTNTSITMKN